jgi:hypothetical protein
MAAAITYSTTVRKGDLRTVIVEDVRSSIVLLPQGRLSVLTAKLLHGTACRKESFWDEVLGQAHDDDTFVIPADQVLARREIAIAVKVKRHKGSAK